MLDTKKKIEGGRCKSKASMTCLWTSSLMIWCMVFYALAPLIIQAQSGNIAPNAIEIDTSANLVAGDPDSNLRNPGTFTKKDWILDGLPPALGEPPPDYTDSIATGVIPGLTGANGGNGHWNGLRVVDRVASGDTDIFLTGGKENDTSTWNVGPGSVGSSKYDVTQAYIANNTASVFFGMERRGNNGTTAFVFEFNAAGTAGGYIPTRTNGDRLLTFEMQGSGGSGSATPHAFHWVSSSSTFVEDDISGQANLFTTINNSDTAPEPWGYVDSKGNWVLSPNIPRFEFAEAQVPLSLIGTGVSGCGGAAFVQVRTRSSATAGSDLKDTTKIFKYVFAGPSAGAQLTPQCGLHIAYDGSASKNASGGTSNLTYAWQFQKNSAADGTGAWSNVGTKSDVSGVFDAPSAGRYRAILTITEGGACQNDVTTDEVNINDDVGGTASLSNACDGTFGYTAAGSGGTGSYSFAWTFYKLNTTTSLYEQVGTSTSASGSISPFTDGTYRADVTIKDTANCPITKNAGPVDARNALTAAASKTGSATSASAADSGFTATVGGSTNSPNDSPTFQWQRLSSGGYVNITGETGSTLSRSMTNIFTDGSIDAEGIAAILGDSYKLRRGTLTVRLHASRTVGGLTCTADSSGVDVKALKAIDP
jgi:hypothetical protein